jgi:hypothetical protein
MGDIYNSNPGIYGSFGGFPGMYGSIPQAPTMQTGYQSKFSLISAIKIRCSFVPFFALSPSFLAERVHSQAFNALDVS